MILARLWTVCVAAPSLLVTCFFNDGNAVLSGKGELVLNSAPLLKVLGNVNERGVFGLGSTFWCFCFLVTGLLLACNCFGRWLSFNAKLSFVFFCGGAPAENNLFLFRFTVTMTHFS